MTKVQFFPKSCKSCGLCLIICPFNALVWNKEIKGVYGESTPEVLEEKCTQCLLCEINCPDCAILVERKKKG